ncbi:hypothetical protein [Aureibaculum luteum]|uniref:hypothetical protein n=1 Tax=Aureibaculum luteum TaxID=1548456 RepID=UPI0013002337|nr:hypothetical protein [Aureibaculum luteum]
MNKYFYITIFTLGICFNKINAQEIEQPIIPLEHVFVHFNTSFLVSGENIYYKLYCINTNTEKLSTLSKIAYLELIDNDLKSIFKHKIKLENGVSSGDFFIPADIASGNYKLIAYTHWMRNWSNNIFKNDMFIINPFEKNRPDIFVKNDSLDIITNHTLIDPLQTISGIRNTNNYVTLSVLKKKYGLREKVELNISNSDPINNLGNYSISVAKIDSIFIPRMFTSVNYAKLFESKNRNKITFLPELRGELISGKVLNINKEPVSNSIVAISLPGKNFQLKIATTNNNGSFYTYLNNNYPNNSAIFQILDMQNEEYNLYVDKHTPLVLKDLEFSKFKVTPAMRKIIINRSVQNQIENSYSSIKLDYEDSIFHIEPFYKSKITQTYRLDDYTRFPSVKETAIEIMSNVFVRQHNKKSTMHVIFSENQINFKLLPMIIIDGILVQNHEEALAYNPNNIDKIHVIQSQYVYGSKIYQGIISIETKQGNYKTLAQSNSVKEINLFKPLVKKHYYKQVYDNKSNFDRIPDYRNILFWEPYLTLPKKNNQLSFYASDITGYYQIRLEGFNEDGSPISLQEIIKVN